MDLYIMRHGQTPYNIALQYNGITSDELTEEGRRQAQKAGETLKDMQLDLILCSPLLRTRQTCELANVNHVPVLYDELLMERDIGELVGRPYNCVDQQEMWNLDSDYTTRLKGVESPGHVLLRAQQMINKIQKEHAGKSVLLITHGGLMRAFNAVMRGIPESRNLRDYTLVDNCTLQHFEL